MEAPAVDPLQPELKTAQPELKKDTHRRLTAEEAKLYGLESLMVERIGLPLQKRGEDLWNWLVSFRRLSGLPLPSEQERWNFERYHEVLSISFAAV
jgi:hypothetical protein